MAGFVPAGGRSAAAVWTCQGLWQVVGLGYGPSGRVVYRGVVGAFGEAVGGVGHLLLAGRCRWFWGAVAVPSAGWCTGCGDNWRRCDPPCFRVCLRLGLFERAWFLVLRLRGWPLDVATLRRRDVRECPVRGDRARSSNGRPVVPAAGIRPGRLWPSGRRYWPSCGRCVDRWRVSSPAGRRSVSPELAVRRRCERQSSGSLRFG